MPSKTASLILVTSPNTYYPGFLLVNTVQQDDYMNASVGYLGVNRFQSLYYKSKFNISDDSDPF